MKKNAYLLLSCLFIIFGVFMLTKKTDAQTMNFWEPFNFQANYMRSINLPAGTASDSLVVKLSNGWFGRVAAPVQNYIVNSTTVGLTKANLNSSYPNVAVGYLVLCPSISLGGAVYIKTTENGSNDVWQLISAPPVM